MPNRLKQTIKFFLHIILATFYKIIIPKNKNKTRILLIKPDGVGDYVIFRHFLRAYKEEFPDNPIDLLCSTAVYDFAQEMDSNFISRFIPLDNIKIEKDLRYMSSILYKIRKTGYKTTIYPVYSRQNTIDTICYVSSSCEKITFDGDISNTTPLLRSLSSLTYTKVINSKKGVLFEFYRNEEFCNCIFGKKKRFDIDYSIAPTHPRFTNEKYIVIFPGASSSDREWPTSNYADLIKYILNNNNNNNNNNILFKIAGSKKEGALAHKIIQQVGKEAKVENLCGTTSLLELWQLIEHSYFLISNDTGAIHIAAAVNTYFICISNGKHFGRYTPYPVELSARGRYVYPNKEVFDLQHSDLVGEAFRFGSVYTIESIKLEQVINEVDNLMFILNHN